MHKFLEEYVSLLRNDDFEATYFPTRLLISRGQTPLSNLFIMVISVLYINTIHLHTNPGDHLAGQSTEGTIPYREIWEITYAQPSYMF